MTWCSIGDDVEPYQWFAFLRQTHLQWAAAVSVLVVLPLWPHWPPYFWRTQFCVLWGPGCCGSSPFWRREGSWLFHDSSSACRGALCCHQIHLPLTPEASRLSHPTFILPWFSFCLSWIKWRFECIHIPRVYGISLNFYHSWQHGSVGPYLNHSWPIEFMILFILSCHQED